MTCNVEKGIIAAIGVVVGLVSDKVIELGFGVFDRANIYSSQEYKKKQDNLKSILDYWNNQNNFETKAIYLSMYVKSGLVDGDMACPLISFAMSSDPERKIARALLTTFGSEYIFANLDKGHCDLAKYLIDSSVDESSKGGDSVNADKAISCPTGTLYTQFGAESAMDAARRLTRRENAFSITEPDFVEGYDGKYPVIRYFNKSDEGAAKAWHDYLERNIPKVDFKYAELSGYEASVKPKTFELWWPKSTSVPVLDAAKFVCGQTTK
jgi:hypothetical protein